MNDKLLIDGMTRVRGLAGSCMTEEERIRLWLALHKKQQYDQSRGGLIEERDLEHMLIYEFQLGDCIDVQKEISILWAWGVIKRTINEYGEEGFIRNEDWKPSIELLILEDNRRRNEEELDIEKK